MNNANLVKMSQLVHDPDSLEATICYLAENLSFLKEKDKVLILFSRNQPDRIGTLMGEAIRRRGAEPIYWEGDTRWKALLRLAFESRATAVFGPPLILLGLFKLARYYHTPLYVRDVIAGGYPCLDWMAEGIVKGFDCKIHGCFDPGAGPVVAGFSCGEAMGVHVREEEFGIDIVDPNGNPLPEGELGQIVLYLKKVPQIRYHHTDRARLVHSACPCGSKAPLLVDFTVGGNVNKDLADLGQYLHSWTSVLDIWVAKGPHGLELELVTFPGERLPQLPSCAKQVIRPWDPETDRPFIYTPNIIKPVDW